MEPPPFDSPFPLLTTQDPFARKVLDALLNGIYIVDYRTFRILYVNTAYTRLTGYTLERLQSLSAEQTANLFHPEEQHLFWEGTAHVAGMSDEDVHEVEYRFHKADGTWIWCVSRHQVFSRYEDGSVKEYIGSFVDITPRKQFEIALMHSEERFRSLVEATTAIVWTTPPSGEFESPQPAWTAFTGQSWPELRGWGWLNAVHPDDQEIVRKGWLEERKQAKKLEAHYRLRRYDGVYRHVSVRVVPILNRNGSLREWIGVHVDEEDLVTAEASLRQYSHYQEQIISATRQILACHHRQHLLQTMVDAIRDLTGARFAFAGDGYAEGNFEEQVYSGDCPFANAESSICWQLDGLMQDTALAGCIRFSSADLLARESYGELMSCLQPGGGVITAKLSSADGSLRGVIAACGENAFSADDEGALNQLAAISSLALLHLDAKRQIELHRDELEQRVSERTAMAEERAAQLQALARQLTQVEETERQRLADILHDELQQLLVGAKYHLGLLRRKLNEPEQAENIIYTINQMIEEAATQSRDLSHELSPPALRRKGLIQALQSLISQIQEKHQLHVQFEYNAEAEPRDENVKTILYKCAQELLFNVVKHAHASTVWLNLRRDNESLYMQISDNGCGFPQDITPGNDHAIFTGFGLLRIQERIRSLGGDLLIHSHPGQGSSFNIVLPIEVASSHAA